MWRGSAWAAPSFPAPSPAPKEHSLLGCTSLGLWPKTKQTSSDLDFLTSSLPVNDLGHCCFAIRVGGRGWGRLCRGLKAGVEEAVREVGVFLQISVARADKWYEGISGEVWGY